MKLQKTSQIVLLAGILLSACVEQRVSSKRPAPPLERFEPEEMFVHTIRFSGETLAIIALWYTGSADHWKAIQNATPNVNPRTLALGQQIRIPQGLLKRKDSITREFVARFMGAEPTTENTPEGSADPENASTGEQRQLGEDATLLPDPREDEASVSKAPRKADPTEEKGEANVGSPKSERDELLEELLRGS